MISLYGPESVFYGPESGYKAQSQHPFMNKYQVNSESHTLFKSGCKRVKAFKNSLDQGKGYQPDPSSFMKLDILLEIALGVVHRFDLSQGYKKTDILPCSFAHLKKKKM